MRAGTLVWFPGYKTSVLYRELTELSAAPCRNPREPSPDDGAVTAAPALKPCSTVAANDDRRRFIYSILHVIINQISSVYANTAMLH